MADAHFVGDGRFPECTSKRLVVEQRIVSEAAGPPWRIQNPALHSAAKCSHQFSVLDQRDDADESRAAVGMIADALQQEGVVIRVGGVRSGIPRGMHAGSPFERVHLKPRIVCKQISTGEATVVLGLTDGVLFKRRANFVRGRHGVGRLAQIEIRRGQLKLAQFSRIRRRAKNDHASKLF